MLTRGQIGKHEMINSHRIHHCQNPYIQSVATFSSKGS